MNPTPVRLVPTWTVVTLWMAVALMFAIGLGMAFASDGADRWIAIGMLVVALCGVVFLAYGLWPRTPRPLSTGPDGTVSIAAPVVQVVAALIAWLAAWAVSSLFIFVIATRGLGVFESPGAVVVMVGATLASAPDVVRLLTGRLHRWRLTWGPDGVSYRGYRTSLDLPPGALKGTRFQATRLYRWGDVPQQLRPRRGTPRGFGLVLERSGNAPGVLVPQMLFRVPVTQLQGELRAAVRQSGRR